MQLLDRVALIVRVKRRFVEWANALPGEHASVTLDDLRGTPLIYLVAAAYENSKKWPDPDLDPAALIGRHFVQIFADALGGWEEDESLWPPNRTLHVFRDWFDVELCDLVQDLDDDLPLVDETYGFEAHEAMTQCGWCLRELGEDEEPIPVTVPVTTDEPLQIPEDRAVPWFVPNEKGVALATAPEDGRPPSEGRSTLTFWVCSAECAAALKSGIERQVVQAESNAPAEEH